MMRYKRCAATDIDKLLDEKSKVEPEIHPELQKIKLDLGSVDLAMLNQITEKINTMAVGLTGWIDGATEGENRIEAANRILKCYVAQLEGKTDETATELDLERLGLKTLPPGIGRLTSLENLFLRCNQLATVPAEIGQLTSLNCLILHINQLATVPAEIGLLTNLERLYLFDNQLATLPPEIGRLTRLEDLYLNGNRLTTLPAEIGWLTSLKKLFLQNNQLRSAPDSITNVGINCRERTEVNLEGNPLPYNVLTRLREASNDNLQFQVSIQERFRPADFTTLQGALQFWLERPEELEFNTYDEGQKRALKEFLSQLRGSAEYKNRDTQTGFKIRVSKVLHQIARNQELGELYLEAISNSLTNCNDRTSAGFSQIEMRVRQAELTQAAIESCATESDESIALKEYHKSTLRYELLEKYISNKLATMRFVDEIEVWLYFMTKLKEVLALPIQTEEMLYGAFAERALGLSEEDIQAAQQFVISKMAEIDIAKELSNWESWQHVQRAEEWSQFNFNSLATQTVADTEVCLVTYIPVSELDAFFVLEEGRILSEEALKKCWISNGKNPFRNETIKLEELKKGTLTHTDA